MINRALHNGFTLLVPVLVLNIVLSPYLTQAGYTENYLVPEWLLLAETVLRLFVFFLPLFLPLSLKRPHNQVGLFLYVFGLALYSGSWLVEILAPTTAVAGHPVLLLAPFYTPLLFMTGIGLMGSSGLYILLSCLFIITHTYHGLLSFGLATLAPFLPH